MAVFFCSLQARKNKSDEERKVLFACYCLCLGPRSSPDPAENGSGRGICRGQKPSRRCSSYEEFFDFVKAIIYGLFEIVSHFLAHINRCLKRILAIYSDQLHSIEITVDHFCDIWTPIHCYRVPILKITSLWLMTVHSLNYCLKTRYHMNWYLHIISNLGLA